MKFNGNSVFQQKKKLKQQRRRGICSAELQQDAPFAIAIGACMLNSLLFSDTKVSSSDDDDDEDAAISSTDARFSVMTIIGFIPYFNWLVSFYVFFIFVLLHLNDESEIMKLNLADDLKCNVDRAGCLH